MENKLNRTKQYKLLGIAFDFYNKEFFGNELPLCIFTLNKKNKGYGYYSKKSFINKNNEEITMDEISLNPYFFNLEEFEAMQTLMHEMVHLWQDYFGNAPKKNYHNKEWSEKMENIGLMPSNTGKEGGKKTGSKMADYIIKDSKFDNKTKELLKNKNIIELFSKPIIKDKKSRNKNKYTCPLCQTNIWGKPGLKIICSGCDTQFEQV